MAKKWILGQKTAFSARNSAFFYATPMKPPFFRLGRSRLNGIISPLYPEVTLDTFSFPVGGRLAAWRAVSWPQLPKVALLGPITLFFGPKSIFLRPASKKVVTIVTGHLKDDQFVLTALQGVREAVQVLFRPKISPKFRFFYASPKKPTFWVSVEPDRMRS